MHLMMIKKQSKTLKDHYSRGGLGDMKVKKYLYEVMEHKFKDIREKRAEYAKDLAQVQQIIKEGTERAQDITNSFMKNVKESMGLN